MKMRSKHTLTFTFLLFTLFINAQNLIPNGDFEDFSTCPTSVSQSDKLDFWFSPTMTGSPDFLHICGTPNSSVSVPANNHSYQYPQSGEGFIGLLLYRNLSTVVREYISTELTETLEADVCYQFEMFINLVDRSRYAIDRIGVYFSDEMITDEAVLPLAVEPIIETPVGDIFSDTMNWVSITGEFQANGTENYVVIGNFRTDSLLQVETFDPPNSANYAYYYFDNISLTKCIANDVDQFDLSQNISIGPNPTSGELNVHIKNQENQSTVQVQLYDVVGQLIFMSEKTGNDIYRWNIDHLPQGTYFLRIDHLGKKYTRKIMKTD